MRFVPSVVVCFLFCACGGDKGKVLILSEINMLGNRHDLTYKGDTLTRITYSTFITKSETDTVNIDTVIRRDVDSVIYEPDNSISLLRTYSRHSSYGKVHRRFRFDADNLLASISRFNGEKEYITDSITYDYTAKKAYYFDLVNNLVEVLEYDRDNNITSIVVNKADAAGGITLVDNQQMPQFNPEASSFIQATYNYFSPTSDPFLINLKDSELLFGCFRRNSVGLFWNGGRRPEFRSANNVQAAKHERNKVESNALFEYQMKDGLPTARYGGDGVVYYRYRVLPD
jgi:hypothetical protein